MKSSLVFLLLLTFSTIVRADDTCILRNGKDGNLLVVQYKGIIEGSFKEQKVKFNDILRVQLEEESIFEIMPDSVSVSARTAKVCVSTVYGPYLVQELLNRADFVIGNDDIDVNPTQ